MKSVVSLLLLLCTVNFTSFGRPVLKDRISQPVPEIFQADGTNPITADSVVSTIQVDLSRFKKYLESFSSFTDVLITFSLNSNNQIYFIALAANKPLTGESLKPTDMAGKEFSTEPNGDPTNKDGRGNNRADQQKFKSVQGMGLTFPGYYMNRVMLLNELNKISSKTVSADIVKTTNNSTGQTYMDVIFRSDTQTTSKTLTSMDSATLSGGCPPFNCDY